MTGFGTNGGVRNASDLTQVNSPALSAKQAYIGNAAVSKPPPATNPTTGQVNGAVPPTTAASNNATSQQTQAATVALLQQLGGLQNPLNSFFQVQPIFTLFMTQDIDPFSAAQTVGVNLTATSTTQLSTQIYSVIAKMKQIVLAQTGVTGYNIKSVEIESVVGPNSYSKMTTSTKFSITITEPMGVGFQEAMLAAAQSLGVKNYLKTFFYLQLSFIAYDEMGNIVTNPVESLQIPNQWIWQISITDIDVELNAGGGTYTLSCVPWNETCYDPAFFNVPDTLTVGGGTLQSFTDNFSKALDAAWFNRYANTTTQYKFQWYKLSDTLQGNFSFDDPTTFTTTFTDDEINSIEGLSLSTAKGDPQFVLQNGVNIAEFIQAVIMNTQQMQKLAKDDAAAGSTPLTTPGFRRSIVWMVEPDVQFTGQFETYTQQYFKLVTFHIRPYYTQVPIIDNDQAQQAQQTGVSFKALQDMVSQGLVKKRYDYLYTGLNIDVIDFNIHYNFQWSAIISKFAGQLTNTQMIAPASRIVSASTVNTGIAKPQAAAQTVSNQVSIAQLQQNYEVAALANDKAQQSLISLQSQTGANQKDITAAQNLTQQTSAAKTAAFNAFVLGQNSSVVPLASVIQSNSGVTYAESLISAPATTTSSSANVQTTTATQVSTVQAFRSVDDAAGTGTIQDTNIDKSVFSAIMGQLYTPLSSQFFTIEMGIRGDPFWLSQTNLLRVYYMRNKIAPPKANIPDMFVGDNCFLMHFRMPIGYGDDFTPTFKDSMVFNGIYKVCRVKSTFGGSDGFKQELQGQRLVLISTADAASNQGSSTTPVTDIGEAS